MPKGENLIPHVKITNTSSGKTVMLDGEEAKSVLGQIDAITAENRLKSYIRYQDPATKNQVVMELCCVEIEQLPSTIEEFDARDCDLDCCEQRFFRTFNTSVNQQTGAFLPKKSDSKPQTTDKPSDSSSSSETKPSTDTSGTEQSKPTEPSGSSDTSTTTPSDNTASGSTENSGTTTPSTPSNSDTTNPSDSGTTGNTDSGTTSGDTSTTPSGNTDTGSTSNPTDETKPSTSTDSGSTGSTDTSSSSQTEPSKQDEKKITNTFNLIYEGADEGTYYTFTVTGNKGDVVNIWDYIKDKVKKNDEGKYYFIVDGNDYVFSGEGNLMDTTRTLEKDENAEDFTFTYEEKPEKITNTVNLTYSGKDKGIYYSFDISGYNGDKVPVWDYIKDKVQQDENGKYYITVNGDKYPYANLNDDLKTRFETVNNTTTKEIPFEYPKEDKE